MGLFKNWVSYGFLYLQKRDDHFPKKHLVNLRWARLCSKSAPCASWSSRLSEDTQEVQHAEYLRHVSRVQPRFFDSLPLKFWHDQSYLCGEYINWCLAIQQKMHLNSHSLHHCIPSSIPSIPYFDPGLSPCWFIHVDPIQMAISRREKTMKNPSRVIPWNPDKSH